MRVSHKHSLPKKLAVHRVLYPSMLTESWVEGKSVEEKDAQPTERTVVLWGLSSKIDSRIWVNFTRNGLRLGSRHQEPPHTDVSRNLATVVVRGVLPGLRRRRTGLLSSGTKSSFQMRASFVFHLETKVLESGGRVEKLIAQVSWSPVLSFQTVGDDLRCNVICWRWSIVKTNVTAPVYQVILEHFMLLSADQLFKDADLIRDAPVDRPKIGTGRFLLIMRDRQPAGFCLFFGRFFRKCEHVICVEDIRQEHNKHRKTDTMKRTVVGVTLLAHK